MSAEFAPVLVTGATGRQGRATVRALLKAGFAVRGLVRDPGTPSARAVEALGVEIVTGDLHDRDSLRRAVEGARAVFSVQTPDPDDLQGDSELVRASNLIEAARDAGVTQFVHTSVYGAGQRPAGPGPAERRWAAKAAIQEQVREAGFPYWTLIKPAFLMENFLSPSPYLPKGPEGGLVTDLEPDTEVALTAVADVGTAAAAAFAAPERFHGIELELVGDHLPMARIAEILSSSLGAELKASSMTADEALAAGVPEPGLLFAWHTQADRPARSTDAPSLGIPLTTFAKWADRRLRPPTLEDRIRRLEDRVAIVEQVVKYAVAADRRDWQMFGEAFTDPMFADHTRIGAGSGQFTREDFAGRTSAALDGFTATQHISPNHIVEFDEDDPDRAVCQSTLYAQHLLEGAEGGDYWLMRGSYINHMLRTPDGWCIARAVVRPSWSDGNLNALAEAMARNVAQSQTGS